MTPEAIEKVEFPPALRGYDKQQVRACLQKLGSEFRTLQRKLSEAEAKVAILSASPNQASAVDMPNPVEAEAQSLESLRTDQFDKFGLQIAGLLRDARDSADQTKSKADLQSQALLEKARSESERQMAASKAEADRIIASAKAGTQQAELDAVELVKAAKAEAALTKSTVDAEVKQQRDQCELDTRQRYDAAEKIISDKQAEADELWISAESEARKIREGSKAEAAEIIKKAKEEKQSLLASIETEIEVLRQTCDQEVAELRKQATDDAKRLRIESKLEAEDRALEAEKILTDHQNQATEILAHANGEAERLMSDAFAEADRIRLDGETSVIQLRKETEAELSLKQEEADAYVLRMTKKGDSYITSRREEGDSFYQQRFTEAEEYVAARQGEVFKDAEEAQLARDQAFAEIADARGQVADLLEQARAQSEFIRQEAEEVIRSRVRANIDQTERRIARLRLTEQSSRERILAAQQELQNAIVHIDLEPVVELGDGSSDAVITEATERALASGETVDTDALITAISDAQYGSGNAKPTIAAPNNHDEAKNDIELDLTPADEPPPNIDIKAPKKEDAAAKETDKPKDLPDETSKDADPNSSDNSKKGTPGDRSGFTMNPPMPPPSTSTPEPALSNIRPGGKTPIESQSTVTEPLHNVDQVLSGPSIEPQDEDALSRLVQEAMKRAVESAKGSPDTPPKS